MPLNRIPQNMVEGLTEQLADIALDIKNYGANPTTGFDNISALNAALSALPVGGTLLIPSGTYEFGSEWLINKQIKLICQGVLKFTGTGNAVTLTVNDSVIEGINITRAYDNTKPVSALVGTGLRLYGVKKTRIIRPVISGFSNGILSDISNNVSNAYIDIYSPKIMDNMIGYNRPNQSGTGWCNELNFFGGDVEINTTFSSYTGSKYINLEAGDRHRFFGVTLESNVIERKIYCNGSYNLWVGCRFEGTNNNLDIEIDGTYNKFVDSGRIWWQNKIVDNGQMNSWDFPQPKSVSVANKTYYVDPVNGNDSNNGVTSSTPVKTITQLQNMLPRQIDHTYTVNLAAGTYANGITLSDIKGQGSLTIQGATSDPTQYIVPSISLRNVHLSNGCFVKYIEATSNINNAQIYAYNSQVNFDTLNATASSGLYGLLAEYGSSVVISNTTISNKSKAILSQYNARVTQISNSGTGNTTGLSAYSGGCISQYNTTVPSATTAIEKNYGGIIISPTGTLL